MLTTAGAVAIEALDPADPDRGVAAHYGDPLREQRLLSLIGTGGRTMAVYAAVVMPFLFLLWTMVERFARRRPRRRR